MSLREKKNKDEEESAFIKKPDGVNDDVPHGLYDVSLKRFFFSGYRMTEQGILTLFRRLILS